MNKYNKNNSNDQRIDSNNTSAGQTEDDYICVDEIEECLLYGGLPEPKDMAQNGSATANTTTTATSSSASPQTTEQNKSISSIADCIEYTTDAKTSGKSAASDCGEKEEDFFSSEYNTAPLYIDKFTRIMNASFLTRFNYAAVVFNYSGAVVNDSYVHWQSMKNTFTHCNTPIDKNKDMSYIEWRMSSNSTFDSYVCANSSFVANTDARVWYHKMRLEYHNRYMQERLILQQHIHMVPGFIEFVDKLDLLGIPWYIKVHDDFVVCNQLVQEMSFLTSFSYVMSKNITHKMIYTPNETETEFCKYITTPCCARLDRRGQDRFRQFLSMVEFLKRIKSVAVSSEDDTKKTEQYILNSKILWFVDNIVDCDIAKQLDMPVAAFPLGASDLRQFLMKFTVPYVDPSKGYLSLL